MPKQLTIFDVEPVVSFDSKKATIHRLNSKVCFADVVVQIPRQAKAIDELKPSPAPDERYELFEDYSIGIWRYKRVEDKQFEYEEAEEMCKRARDEKEPIPIRLHLSLEQAFVPENVVQYL
ncbi:cell division protein SepF [Bacillus pseudomycoides]|uniref:cell division protein SepF n=1 Tax=Bacillus TaxID=1386 RepID=UPI000BEDB672|nr:cell division protein SepF [Bacillus pseudomycoides]MCR8856521.1 cell division protein SepF [Bacillus pseudomycoides]PEF25384.1 cell division protein SepF [Bacillus pseudomycoides]PEJ25135.1 cell division protein SepF [Bacillus pseudomycoides]PEK67391.1 cell division protein SepF [Bacillus pseudomycoides]PFY58181.1 cell division protein SepF [Bacillus pseudomycoides]